MAAPSNNLPGTRLVVAAVVLSAAATAFLLAVPTYETYATEATLPHNGRVATRGWRDSILAVNSPQVLPPLLLPVIFSAFPLFLRRPRAALVGRLVAMLLLTGFSVLALLSVGVFYLPSAGLLGLSVVPLMRS